MKKWELLHLMKGEFKLSNVNFVQKGPVRVV